MDNTGMFIAGILSLLGIIFAAVGGILLYFARKSKAERTIRTYGVIVSWAERHSDNGITYAPIVQYTDGEGNEYTCTSSVSKSASLMKRHQPGTPVTVLFDALDPSKARIEGYEGSVEKLLAMIFLGVGVILLTAAVITSLLI